MKKLISTVLLFAMALSLLAGCTIVPADPAENLDDARKYVVSYFQGSSATTDVDYTVIGSVLVNEVKYTIAWTTDNENVKIVPQEDGFVLIDVPELTSEEVYYTLTATITAPSGATADYSITRKISAAAGVGKTDEDIVKEAYALEKGAEMEGAATLTGVVKSIRIPYDAGYGNITVIIQVGNLADMPIDCYRLKGDGVADLAPGDTVTIQGVLKNHEGTVQFNSGSVATKIVKGPAVSCPATPAEILAAAKALTQGWALPYKSSLTGVVTEITSAYDAKYMNLTCNITVDGNTIICYRLLGELGASLKVGDTITVTGYLMNYKGDLEYGQGCTLDSLVPGEGGGETQPSTQPQGTVAYVDAPVAGTAYKLVMNQAGLSKHLGITGKMSGYYWATSESAADMVDVYLEVSGSGYSIYFMNGDVKTYLNVIPRDTDATKTNVVFQTLEDNANPTVYTLNTEYKYIYVSGVTADDWYLGTYGTNVTVGASKTSYIDDKATIGVSQFVAWFATFDGSNEPSEDPSEPSVDPSEPTEDPTQEPSTGVMSIPEVLASAEGTAVVVKGTVSSIYQAWSDQYKNISFYISDEAGNKLLVFRTGTKAAIGDKVTVTGKATVYSGTIQIAQGGVTVIDEAHTCSFTAGSCVADSFCTNCGAIATAAPGHKYVDGFCSACGAAEPVGEVLPGNLIFTAAANKADADAYMKSNFPEWKITGKLGQTYGGYLGFGRSGDGKSAITSPEISVTNAFTVTTVLKGNGSSGVATSTLTFTLVDKDGNTIATGYANGSSTAAITPADAKDTTYNISFTFVDGKTWSDVSNLVVSFAKSTGNIGLKTLDFVQ